MHLGQLSHFELVDQIIIYSVGYQHTLHVCAHVCFSGSQNSSPTKSRECAISLKPECLANPIRKEKEEGKERKGEIEKEREKEREKKRDKEREREKK